MNKLYYVGLEPYESRYTLQLMEWSKSVYEKRGIVYHIINGKTIDTSKEIKIGHVLDAHGRTYYSLSQCMEIVQLLRNGAIKGNDVIYFEDMFTPGIESIPYILNQIPKKDRPAIWVHCLAQSIDPDDFIHVYRMHEWMRLYELMLTKFITGVFASSEEMVMHMKIAGWDCPIYNISGLAFGKDEVKKRVNKIIPFDERKRRISFAARWDNEKQPDFFMNLCKEIYKIDPEIEFSVLSGRTLDGNNKSLISKAYEYSKKYNFKIYDNLTKNEYYELLVNSRVLFNCALQDWVSYTVLEADTLETNVIYPAYRSFPEVFSNDSSRLYVPWSLTDALNKTLFHVENQSPFVGKISDWGDKTIDRMIDIMAGSGEQWKRGYPYRHHLSEEKY